MPFFVARCQWRADGSHDRSAELPDAWSLLDEEFESPDEARAAAEEDRLQFMQQRGGWMGVHRLGLDQLGYRFIEAADFDRALALARRRLDPPGPASASHQQPAS